MNNYVIPTLIIGLVVAFGVGFFVGHAGREVVYPFPVNYNPAQQAANDAVKVSQQGMERCYQLIADQLQHPRECQPKEVAH